MGVFDVLMSSGHKKNPKTLQPYILIFQCKSYCTLLMPAMGKAGFGRVYRANFHGKFQKKRLGKANKKAPQPVGLSAFFG